MELLRKNEEAMSAIRQKTTSMKYIDGFLGIAPFGCYLIGNQTITWLFLSFAIFLLMRKATIATEARFNMMRLLFLLSVEARKSNPEIVNEIEDTELIHVKNLDLFPLETASTMLISTLFQELDRNKDQSEAPDAKKTE